MPDGVKDSSAPTTVRVAAAADLESLVALNAVVQGVHARLYPKDFRPVVDTARVTAMFAAQLAGAEKRIALAEVAGTPVGYVLFEAQTLVETAFNKERRRLYVHHLCVIEAMRRRGVATQLLHVVEEHAAANGIDEIALDAWAANEGAIKFFEASGFAPFNISLRKQIPSG